MAETYTWSGSNTGVWADPSNWTDVTTTPTLASVPPGPFDEVDLNGGTTHLLVVNGPGNADTLTVSNDVELNGSYYVNELDQSGTLAMLTGSLVAGVDGTITGFVDLAGGGMMINGLALNGGSLEVDPGAFMEVGSDGTADGTAGLVVDANATFTLAAGMLTISNILNNGYILATASTSAPLAGTNGGYISGLSVDTIVNTGTVASGDGQSVTVGDMTGGGEVDVSTGGTVEITQNTTANVVFQDVTGTLELDGTGLASDSLTITGFGGGDIITLPGSVLSLSFSPNGYGDGTIVATTAAGTFSLDVQGNYDSAQVGAFLQDGTGQVVNSMSLPCFVTGTHIMTRHGEVAVESLRPGDEVATLLPQHGQPEGQIGGFRPVRWIGHRRLRLTNHPSPRDVQPVRVRAGAFGPGLPGRDLYLSPDHALFADNALIPIKYLLNAETVAQVPAEQVTYWHVELDRHDVLLAEGLPAESYLDTGDRAGFANGGAVATLHPRFGPLTWEAEGCAPLVVTGPTVERLRATLRGPKRRRTRRRPAA
jgi:hypothetical protein